MLQKEELSFGHAKVLASVKEQEKCTRMARLAVDEKMSVRQLEDLLKKDKKPKAQKNNEFFDDKIDSLKKSLETKTGFHFGIKNKTNGSGQITIKYNNEAEFNDIFEYLMTK